MARSATPGTPRTKGKQTYLGGYNTEAEAARAYDRAALVYWGEKGNTNFPKSDYAAEMPLLTALTRQEVVANLRSISHTTRTSVPPKHEGVYPHQALTGMWEARLYGAPAAGRPKGAYQLLGAFLTEEAACEALAQATLAMQLEIAAAPADAVVRVAAAASKVPTSAAAAEETPPHALPAQQQQHKLADNAADTGGDPSGRPSCPTQSDGSPANAAAATVEAAATPLFVSEAQLEEAWQVAMRAINGAANFGASGTPTAGI